MNAIKEYVAESSNHSKQYMPQKFAEMSSKFCFGQEFVEKLGILSNFVDRCLYYFCTILYIHFPELSWKLACGKQISKANFFFTGVQ